MLLVLVAVVELAEEFDPLALAAGDLIEVLFHLRREVRLDEVAEVLAQQLRHRERDEARHQRFALTEHVAAPNDCCDRRRKRRRTSDAEPLQLFDQRCFREARRRCGLVLLRLRVDEDDRGALTRDLIADLALRQDGLLLLELRRRIVAAFDIRAAETRELDRLAARRQHRQVAALAARRQLQRRPQHARIHHLRRHRPLPDQLVDLQVVGIEDAFELTRRETEIGGTNRFVRFLRVLHARLIAPRSIVVLRAEHLADDARRFANRSVRQRRRVGAVIGDETFHLIVADVHALEQPLRRLHRALGGEAQLAVSASTS